MAIKFTETEVVQLLTESKTLPKAKKLLLLSFINGAMQAVYNVATGEHEAKIVNDPDYFEQGFNAVITFLQK